MSRSNTHLRTASLAAPDATARPSTLRRLLQGAAGLMIVAGGLSESLAWAAPDETNHRCMFSSIVSADSAERWQQACRKYTEEQAYASCMLDAAGTPNSLERWIDTCRATAEHAAHTDRVAETEPPPACYVGTSYVGGCRQLPGLVDGWFDPTAYLNED